MVFQCILPSFVIPFFLLLQHFFCFISSFFFYFDSSSFAQFIPESYVDGRKRTIKFSELGSSLIAAKLPHFWTSAGINLLIFYYTKLTIIIPEFDPHISLLLTGDEREKDDRGVKTLTIFVRVFSYLIIFWLLMILQK